jgi:hypothetical protein
MCLTCLILAGVMQIKRKEFRDNASIVAHHMCCSFPMHASSDNNVESFDCIVVY